MFKYQRCVCAAQAGSSEEGTRLGQAFTAIVAAVGIVSLAVAGTAVAIYKDVRPPSSVPVERFSLAPD